MRKHTGGIYKIMATSFTKYEAVLLLNAYLEAEELDISWQETARRCSILLRQIAVNQGKKIDSAYRNVTGISHQIACMESAYRGRTITEPATRLFLETVKIYRENREYYSKLLEEARLMTELPTESAVEVISTQYTATEEPISTQMIASDTGHIAGDTPRCQVNRESFARWMRDKQHMAETTCRGYASAVNKAEIYAAKNGLASGRLYTSDVQEAIATAKALFQDEKFRQRNERQHNYFSAAIKKLLIFLDSSETSFANEPTSNEGATENMIPENLLSAIQHYYENGIRFDDTVFRLLEERSSIKISGEIKTKLKTYMFCRKDCLYFCQKWSEMKNSLPCWINIRFYRRSQSLAVWISVRCIQIFIIAARKPTYVMRTTSLIIYYLLFRKISELHMRLEARL